MKRIDSPNRAVALFGAGRDGFKAAVPGVSSATELTAKWFNALQEAVARTIEGAGLSLSDTDFDQFTAAVQWYADTAAAQRVAALVNSSPAALDTLNELAAALANDPNFAATMTTALANKERRFDPGTRMLFQQTVAPVGWTKVTTFDNAALRVVSGAAGSGGTLDFTAAFVNGSTGLHVLTVAEIPSHGGHLGVGGGGEVENPIAADNLLQGPIGGGQGHSHTIALDVKYVDLILASKD